MATPNTGSFANEDALDWLDSFTADGARALQAALGAVNDLDPNDYLEAVPAAHALAAAEIVAAARDGDTERVPEEALERISEDRAKLCNAPLVDAARNAVERVVSDSELKELWDDTEHGELWEEEVRELLDRL